MEINPISSGVQTPSSSTNAGISGKGAADVATLKQAESKNGTPSNVQQVTETNKAELSNADQRRYETVERGAQAMAMEMFAVSDSTFTIFKDASGQFVTRFTSLRDGSVTYYPEPEVAAFMEKRMAERQASYDIDA